MRPAAAAWRHVARYAGRRRPRSGATSTRLVGRATRDARTAATGRTSTPPTAPATSARRSTGDPALVYVPNSMSNTVDVISQRTLKVVGQFPTGALPQHVTPSYDLKTLYVDNDLGNSLTPIDPRTGAAGQADPGRGPLQPVLHARRPLRDRRRRAPAAARLPQPDDHAPGPLAVGPEVPRASTTWTSRPTAATPSPAASSAAR